MFRFVILLKLAILPLLLHGQTDAVAFELANSDCSFLFRQSDGRLFLGELRKGKHSLTLDAGVALTEWPQEGPVRLEGVRVEQVAATNYVPAHRRVSTLQQQGDLRLRRVFILFDGATGMRGYQSFEGPWPGTTDSLAAVAATSTGVEEAGKDRSVILAARLGLPGPHWSVAVAQFRDQTDRYNQLVQEQNYLLYPKAREVRGSVLLARQTTGANGIWLLKEAPLNDSQLDDVGTDFSLQTGLLSVAGRRYGWALGLAGSERIDLLSSLRRYQLASYRYRTDRDEMVMMNTWGDRGQDGKVNEAFVLRELEIASQLGVTHFQIDDGWQSGLSRNSVSAAGDRWDYWDAEDWRPHPLRFPSGLDSVASRARSLGMELGLWFNASSQDDYATWKRDADILIDLHRDYGIVSFKMDGLSIPNERADSNLRALLDRVQSETGGNVVFNLDATAGQRGGYFYLTEYGNVFVENRYTDWGRYYPHWTLRNLWDLAQYTPPAKLQMEVLNPLRNPDQYPEGDELAPRNFDLDYLFATVAVAQPLMWMEGSNLTESQRKEEVIHQFEPYLEALHTGVVLPIGEQPDGTSWTGFQVQTSDTTGLLLIIREVNTRSVAKLKTRFPPNQRVALRYLTGNSISESGDVQIGPDRSLPIYLPDPRSYLLYRYRLVP